MDSHTFIKKLQGSSLLPDTVREVLIEHADDLKTEEKMNIIKALENAELKNARAFADGAAALRQPIHALTGTTRTIEEKIDRTSDSTTLH